MSLPLVNTFTLPYEAWTTKTPTKDEMIDAYEKTGKMPTYINDQLIANITTPLEAATYIANVGADNGLGYHINSALDNDANYPFWRKSMPPRTPSELSNYQKIYPYCDFDKVDIEINMNGYTLSEGQILFHCGVWPNVDELVTNRPLSTTFCPQVALRNGEHKGKAYEANLIDLFVLRVQNPSTKAFAYKRKGTNLGHENEVLFASGAMLRLRSKTLIRQNYLVANCKNQNKQVPIFVLEIDLS